MAANDFYVNQFGTELGIAAQFSGPDITSLIQNRKTSVRGEGVTFNYLGKRDPQKRTGKYQSVNPSETDENVRWAYPVMWDDHELFDDWDNIRQLVGSTPSDPIITNMAAGFVRRRNLSFFEAAGGTAKTGKDGSGSATFTAGNTVDATAGLTAAKLSETRKILTNNNADLMSLYCAIGASGFEEIQADSTLRSRDNIRETSVLEANPMYVPLMGINFIIMPDDQMPEGSTAANSYAYVWDSRAFGFVSWKDLSVKTASRDDLRGSPIQLGAEEAYGMVRLEEARVARIEYVGS